MEFSSRWGEDSLCDRDKHQTLPLADKSGDVMGNRWCSGKDRVVLSWPAYVFNHQLFFAYRGLRGKISTGLSPASGERGRYST